MPNHILPRFAGLFALGISGAATLTTPASAVQLQQDFAGAYAPANWILNANGGDGSADTAAAPNSITLIGSSTRGIDPGPPVDTDYTTTAAGSGPVSFDWNYSTFDADGYDGFGYLLNSTFTFLTDSPSSGSNQFNVVTGDIFGFRVFSVDDAWGEGFATISNFSAPVPGPLPLLGVGAAFSYSRRLRRRTSLTDGSLSTASQISDRV
jgi:hypothetical protein